MVTQVEFVPDELTFVKLVIVASSAVVGVHSIRFRQRQAPEISEALKAEAYAGADIGFEEVAGAISFSSRPRMRPCPTGGSPAGRVGDASDVGRAVAWHGTVVVI